MVDPAGVGRPRASSRRGFLTGAAGLAGAFALAGCGDQVRAASHPTIAVRPPSARARHGDLVILDAALALERRLITAYAAAIPLLAPVQATWAKAFVGEEVQQAGALAKLISLAGGQTPTEDGQPAIGHPRDAAEALSLLQALESEQVASYLRWIPMLSPGALRAGAATILAADAQHLTALSRARGRPALVSPFTFA